jgi:hypothetical protein
VPKTLIFEKIFEKIFLKIDFWRGLYATKKILVKNPPTVFFDALNF